uniref:Uncharacterized protein n=1 Tax=Glossina morsitans morsitans TaxID=37546 RepID=A0A1B0FAK5_GLOMM
MAQHKAELTNKILFAYDENCILENDKEYWKYFLLFPRVENGNIKLYVLERGKRNTNSNKWNQVTATNERQNIDLKLMLKILLL